MPNQTKHLSKVDVYRTTQTTADLQRIRRTLARTANERLRALERATSPITGESYAYGAYESAMQFTPKGRSRFSESAAPRNMSRADLQREIVNLQYFINAKTSTVRGQKAAEKKRVETFAKGYGKSGKRVSEKTAASKSFYDFLKSKAFSDAKKRMDSEDIIEMYDAARETGKPEEAINNIFEAWNKSQGVGRKALEEALKLREVPKSANGTEPKAIIKPLTKKAKALAKRKAKRKARREKKK